MFESDSIVLTGMPGSGKSTVGRMLAQKLSVPFYDIDAMLIKDFEGTMADFISEKGEDYFRHQEALVCHTVLQHYNGVISLGGGAILNAQTRKLLKSHTVIYLEASLDHLLPRLENDTERPFLQGMDMRAALGLLYRERVALYTDWSNVRICTDGLTPQAVVSAITARVEMGEPA